MQKLSQNYYLIVEFFLCNFGEHNVGHGVHISKFYPRDIQGAHNMSPASINSFLHGSTFARAQLTSLGVI